MNRVRNRCFDQCAWSGHRDRVEPDLERFAALGLRTLRTGLLWEHHAQDGTWRFADRALHTMQQLHLHPIAGLVHHGSGPRSTSLLDPAFPQKLADYALAVARRYPWVTDYTPVNEPQTTGRFSCLYRKWFPHHASMRSYVRALVNQIKAVALSMQAVRSEQPAARLIHTEDAGHTYASASLESYRVEREQRRLLGLDLLCGKVTREHPLYSFLRLHGISDGELAWFADTPCPPDILGLNYYVTSDRYLDDRVDLYAPYMRGGDDGNEPLVDIEAVRVRRSGITGAGTIVLDMWRRYGLPIAITEAHLGSTADEQVRWLAEIWQDVQQAREQGADVRAVTSWGLLGLYNWCHLCTRDTGAYEPGAFDLRGGRPVETEVGRVLRQIASGRKIEHSALTRPGWWRLDSRLTVPEPEHEIFAAAPVLGRRPFLQFGETAV